MDIYVFSVQFGDIKRRPNKAGKEAGQTKVKRES
jgi:hypothetical protein